MLIVKNYNTLFKLSYRQIDLASSLNLLTLIHNKYTL